MEKKGQTFTNKPRKKRRYTRITRKRILPKKVNKTSTTFKKLHKIRNKNDICNNSLDDLKRKQFEYTLKYMYFKSVAASRKDKCKIPENQKKHD